MQKKRKNEQSLGERIALLRKSKGITSSALAEAIDVTQGQVSNYENNKQIPSAIILSSIAETLGTTAEYLLKGEKSSDIEETFAQIGQLSSKNKQRVKDYVELLAESEASKKIRELINGSNMQKSN